MLIPQSIVVVWLCSRRQGVMHRRVQMPKVIWIQGGAAVAQVVQVITDGLIGHDESDGLPRAITSKEAVYAAALAMERLVGDAREGLLP